MTYAICTIIKDERRYLEEWLQHNVNLGFTAIHLYEDEGSESHQDICEKFPKVYLHSFSEVTNPDKSRRDWKQMSLFAYFINKYKDLYDWCAFMDVDEFIRLEDGYTLERICQEFQDYKGIKMCQKTHGANGHITRPEGGLQENYPETTWGVNAKSMTKCFVNLKKSNYSWNTVHRLSGAVYTDFTNKIKENPTYDKIWYDHYYTKSWQDWIERFTKRGDVVPGNVQACWFFDYNKLNLEDVRGYEDLFTGINIGCGTNLLYCWINADINPCRGAVYMDATKPIPLNDASIKYVVCEHLLEHLTLQEGLNLLKEIKRILAPGGIARIALPTKDKLDAIYNSRNQEYVDFHFKQYAQDFPVKTAGVVINNFYRMWGHQTIYDVETLKELFKLAGFEKYKECGIDQSDYYELRNREKHKKQIGKFNWIETQVFELYG